MPRGSCFCQHCGVASCPHACGVVCGVSLPVPGGVFPQFGCVLLFWGVFSPSARSSSFRGLFSVGGLPCRFCGSWRPLWGALWAARFFEIFSACLRVPNLRFLGFNLLIAVGFPRFQKINADFPGLFNLLAICISLKLPPFWAYIDTGRRSPSSVIAAPFLLALLQFPALLGGLADLLRGASLRALTSAAVCGFCCVGWAFLCQHCGVGLADSLRRSASCLWLPLLSGGGLLP